MRKTIKNTFICAMMLSVLASCVDDRNNFMVDDSIGFSMAAEEEVVDLYIFEGGYKFGVIKSGKGQEKGVVNLTTVATADLEAYNAANRTNYVALPENCYTISSNSIDFSVKDHMHQVSIDWDAAAVNAVMTEDAEKDYVIPVKMSSETLAVNESRDFMIINIMRPTYNLVKTRLDDYAVIAEPTQTILKLRYEMDTEVKEKTVVTFEVANDLVARYVQDMKLTDWTEAPAGLIKFPTEDMTLVLNPGDKKGAVDLTIDSSVCFDESGKPVRFTGYVVPVRVKSIVAESGNYDVNIDNGVTYVRLKETFTVPLKFRQVWGYYSVELGKRWTLAYKMMENGDRNVAMDGEYVYVPDCALGKLYKFGINDGQISEVPTGKISNGGTFKVCDPNIIKNTDPSINGGKDILVVTNLSLGTSEGNIAMYAYVNGTSADPIAITLDRNGVNGRYGDKVSITGKSLQDGVELWFKDADFETGTTGHRFLKFSIKGSFESSYTGKVYEFDTPSYAKGSVYLDPESKNYLLATADGSSSFWTSNDDGQTYVKDATFNADYSMCYDFHFFTYKGKRYIAYVIQNTNNRTGTLKVIEYTEGTPETLKQTLENDIVVFETPLQHTDDPSANPDEASAFRNGHSAGGCSVYEDPVTGSIYIVGLIQNVGLSVYKL